MTSDEHILTQFPSHRLISVLGVLQRLRIQSKQSQDQPVPYTTFHLRGGGDISGWLLDMAEDHGHTVVLVHVSADQSNSQPDICYFELDELQAITVHNAIVAADALSFGAIEVLSGTDSPTQMSLQRRADDLAHELSGLIGHPMRITIQTPVDTIDGLSRNRMVRGLEQVAGVLKLLAGSAIGQEALGSRVSEVRVMLSPQPRHVELNQGILTVSFGNEPISGQEELHDLIAAAL